MNVYEIVTQTILDKLDAGVIPWRRPWVSAGAVNWESQKPYRGINAILLDPGEYATFNQISKAGGKVKKGEKGSIVVFYKTLDMEDEEGESKRVPFLRYYKVWNINTQCDGIKSKSKRKAHAHDKIADCEAIVAGYKDAPPIRFVPGRAFYRPSEDDICVPPLADYEKPEEFYSTLFHELVHSTGHRDRLNRAGVTDRAAFGSEAYSFEELVAETGSAFLCGKAGVVQATIDNSAAYIAGWKQFLKNDSRAAVRAASQGQKAADYIMGEEAKA